MLKTVKRTLDHFINSQAMGGVCWRWLPCWRW